MKDKISVVVPIYNVEKYLSRCIDSIINQTYNNLEIILVDDGSPDKCPKICDEYAKNDKRIKVIHKKNGGLSSARNTGIENSTCEYIVFIDSDDYIKNNMIEVLYNNLIDNNADISICDYVKFDENGESYNSYPQKYFTLSGNKKFDYLYNRFDIVTVVQWNKLFKKNIFKNLRYPNGKINEDEFVIANELYNAKKISYVLEPLYYYYQRQDSIMHVFKKNRYDAIDGYLGRIDFFHNINQKKYEICTRNLMIDKIIYLIIKYKNVKKTGDEKKYIKNYINICKKNAKYLLGEKLSFKRKIKLLLFICCDKLLVLIISLKLNFFKGGRNG